MTTEQKILEQILKEGGNASVGLIAKKLKMNNGYIEYLCKVLLKKGLIKKMGKNTWYQVTNKGKKIEKTENLKVADLADRQPHKEEPEIPPCPVVKRQEQQVKKEIRQENSPLTTFRTGEIQKQKTVILPKKKLKKLTDFFKNLIIGGGPIRFYD